jgi:carboxypeptidase Taq
MHAYQTLEKTFARLNNLDHLSSIVGWDYAAMMSKKGSGSRAAAMAQLDVMRHEVITDAQLKTLLQSAQSEGLDQWQQANLREMKRRWEGENLLPAELIEKQALVHGRCEHAWRSQRPANDWKGFLVNLTEVVSLARERADRLSQANGLGLYDSLMDQFEPGTRSADIDRIFGDLKTWLPGFIAEAQKKQAKETVVTAVGPFAIDAQRALGVEIMKLLQFDFEGGRLDVSTHPFCGGVPLSRR